MARTNRRMTSPRSSYLRSVAAHSDVIVWLAGPGPKRHRVWPRFLSLIVKGQLLGASWIKGIQRSAERITVAILSDGDVMQTWRSVSSPPGSDRASISGD